MIVLVRYGEIGLKGKNRPEFERQLVRRIKRALRSLDASVRRGHGRIWIATEASWPEVAGRLKNVFGIVAFSPVINAGLDLEAIAKAALSEFASALSRQNVTPATNQGSIPVTFKVDSRRANKRFPLNSIELNRHIGAVILSSAPPGIEPKVNLERPQIVINVEVRDDGAYVYALEERGLGGLPVGVGGRALALLSGGIDSPVAVWLTMKRGVRVDCIHFHSYPFTSDRSKQKVIDLAKILSQFGGPIELHVVHFTEVQKAIQLHCPSELTITIMRRMMLRIAEQVANNIGADAIVTGESLGQVASQTLESIRTIADVARLPILRPLIAFDKEEIVTLAKKIGTFETSILPYEDCCSIFVPRHPSTRPRIQEAERAETALDIEELVQEALERTEILEL